MSVPRENATTGQRLKALEQEVARLRLQASSTVTTVAPTDAMPRSTWIDPSANNAPYFLDDSGTWIPVRDGNIAVAQATANSALAASTDGLPPASSPAAELIGGIGALFIRWPAVANANPVTYKVYVDTTTGFTPGVGNLVGQTVGTFLTVRTLTAGTALTYGTTYYAKIVATDADGAAAAGVEGSGAMVQVNSPDIAANSIVAGKIAAGTIVAGDISTGAITTTKLAASAVTATELAAGSVTAAKLDAAAITGKTITGGLFRTAPSGGRVEIDSTTWTKQVRFYTGNAGETAPGIVEARTFDMLISEPNIGYADVAEIRLYHNLANSRVEVISTEFAWLNSPVITTDFTQDLTNKTIRAAGHTAWTNLTLVNSWTDFASGHPVPGAILGADGFVTLRGMVRSGTTATATIATLPAGIRPPYTWSAAAISNEVGCRVNITSAGVISASGTVSTVWINLSGVRFSTF